VRESAAAILRQTFADLEVIFVDDASRDDSVNVLRKIAAEDPRVKVIAQEKNSGPSRSRNIGLREAKGEFVAFCDADDLWKPEKLSRQIHLLENNPDCDIAYSDSEMIDESGRLIGRLFREEHSLPENPSGDLFESLCGSNFINTQTVLVRRAKLGERLMFNEHIRLAEDWWLWIRLAREHRFIYDSASLGLYRVHAQNTGKTQRRGFTKSRLKISLWTYRAYPDLPSRIQAQLWYQMGRDLCWLGKRRTGRLFLLKALSCGLKGRLPLPKLARMSARLIEQCVRGPTQAQQSVRAPAQPTLSEQKAPVSSAGTP